jgi:hypothetical protein
VSEYNIFLASPTDIPDAHFDPAIGLIEEKFSAAIPHASVTVVRAKDEWDKSFAQCGDWDAWAKHVATGVDCEYRTPLYNAVVCTAESVGRVTAQIVEQALSARRMVALVHGQDISQVVSVERTDSDNRQSMWRLNTSP